MTGEIIKQFLVSLGFDVDDKTLKKFNKALSDAVTKVGLMAAAVKATAAGVFYGISKISEGFEEMGYQYRIIAPMLNKVLYMRQQLLAAYRNAGINITDAVQQSVRFNMSLAKTKFQLEAIYKSVGIKFLPLLTKQMDLFRGRLIANMPKIIRFFENLVRFIFKAFEAVTLLGVRLWSMLGRVYDFFKMLHEATNGWSTGIMAAVAAWRLLNLSFLASPIGMILTGFVALLALFDDFMTWKEGGDSVFDWSAMMPSIEGTIEIFTNLLGTLSKIVEMLKKLKDGDWSGAFESLKGAGLKLLDTLSNLWNILLKITTLMHGGINGVLNKLFGPINDPKANFNAQQRNFDVSANAPLGSEMAGNSISQTISQSTQIVVQGSSNPTATAREIANQQNRVNSDMTRNLQGAAR